jgi:hypothetical protein
MGMSAPEGFAFWSQKKQRAYLIEHGLISDSHAPMTPEEHSEHVAREAGRHRAEVERERIEADRRRRIAP